MKKLYLGELVFQVVIAPPHLHRRAHVLRHGGVAPLRGHPRRAGTEDEGRPRVHPGALGVGDHQGLRAGVRVHPLLLGPRHHGGQVAPNGARAPFARGRPGARWPKGPASSPRTPASTPARSRPGQRPTRSSLLPAGHPGGPVPLPRDAEPAGRERHVPGGLRLGGRSARLGAVDDPLHRLGHPVDRLHRHRARHRRRPLPGPPRHPGRCLGRHRGPRRRLQLDAHRAAAQPRPDVRAAPAPAPAGASGARHRELRGRAG